MSNVAVMDRPPVPSITVAMADRYGMAPPAFEATLRATVVPKECTREQFAAFLLVAHEYGLNPILKEIYAFPAKGGGIQPVVSIDGWVKLMNGHPQMDGIEFDDHLDDRGQLVSVTARIHRKDRSRPIVVTEYMAECRRNTEPWKQWPHRMLRHKATIQAVRYAFGYAGVVDPDEADVSGMRDVSPPPAPPPAPGAPRVPYVPPHDTVTGEILDAPRGSAPAERSETEEKSPEAGNRQSQAEGGDGGAAVELPQSGPDTTVAAQTQLTAALSQANRDVLGRFAQALAEANTPAAVGKGRDRFLHDNAVTKGSTAPFAVAAMAIADAHLRRAAGEIDDEAADASVRKALAL